MTSLFDYARVSRIGMPEAVLCEGKSNECLAGLLQELTRRPDHPVLLTRLDADRISTLGADVVEKLDYDAVSRTAFVNGKRPTLDHEVAVVAAGTADVPVAREAERTLEFLGLAVQTHLDIGVAGLWRLLDRLDQISRARIVIVVAGMDAALASVIAGLVAQPIIGVPTSVGYGVCDGGRSALHAMLASCAQGLMVMNIDNGFGAACAAHRIVHSMCKAHN